MAEVSHPPVLSDPGDLGRRIATRREQLGLSRRQLSQRAGVTAEYVAYLESQPTQPTPGALIWLAEALETTPRELLGAGLDRPPGQRSRPRPSRLVTLDSEECLGLVSPGGVGRVALTGDLGPEILPVNYVVDDGAVVFRTSPRGPLALVEGTPVGFEVDHLDEAMAQGWSVLLVGRLEHLTDPGERGRLEGKALLQPWAGGTRDLFLRLRPERVTGRRIVAALAE